MMWSHREAMDYFIENHSDIMWNKIDGGEVLKDNVEAEMRIRAAMS